MSEACLHESGCLSIRHLTGLEGVPRDDIERIFATAAWMRQERDAGREVPRTLAGVTVVNMFFENSTRTRLSFETAERGVGATVLNFSASVSSTAKGETLRDTARNIESLGPTVIVVRHASAGVPGFLTKVTRATVLNAGDGAHAHPTQGLLNAFTLRRHLGDLEGRSVAIIGDIRYSRVARSDIWCLGTLGVKVRLFGPATLMPRHPEAFGPWVSVARSLGEALDGVDAVMLLRIQHERQSSGLLPSLREYRDAFGIDEERIRLANPGALVLHPGPINRGIEVSSQVADGPQSVVLEQVQNGVAIRMAVLHLLAGRKAHV